jgi:hypothetical protein
MTRAQDCYGGGFEIGSNVPLKEIWEGDEGEAILSRRRVVAELPSWSEERGQLVYSSLYASPDKNNLVTIEASPAIESSPRPMAYLPVAACELENAGILDAFRKISTPARRIYWRKIGTGEVISEFEQKAI